MNMAKKQHLAGFSSFLPFPISAQKRLTFSLISCIRSSSEIRLLSLNIAWTWWPSLTKSLGQSRPELNFQPSRRHNWNNLIIRISMNLYSNDEKYQASDWWQWSHHGLWLAKPELLQGHWGSSWLCLIAMMNYWGWVIISLGVSPIWSLLALNRAHN